VICLGGVGQKKAKRRRSSFLSASDLSPTSKYAAAAAAVGGAPRLTERQQLALLLQMTAEKRGMSAVDFYVFRTSEGV